MRNAAKQESPKGGIRSSIRGTKFWSSYPPLAMKFLLRQAKIRHTRISTHEFHRPRIRGVPGIIVNTIGPRVLRVESRWVVKSIY